MMTASPTICKNCTHFLNLEPGSPRADVWYNHLCKASPLPVVLNVVTGKMGPAIEDEAYSFCRDINRDGNCEKFE